MKIRPAEITDAQALTNIYNHYVEEGPITFDTHIKSVEERRIWMNQFEETGLYQLFVAEDNHAVIGYVCSTKFRQKPAYDTSIETTIYLHPDVHRKGVGTLLYAVLFDSLKDQDIHRAYAGVTLPNDGSVALHEKVGFESVGVYREVGRKFGRYWDVQWFEKPLNCDQHTE